MTIILLILLFLSGAKKTKDGTPPTTDSTVVAKPPTGPSGPTGTIPPTNSITYNQSFEWATLKPALQRDLLAWALTTPNPLDLSKAKVILKTEITNCGGKTLVWVQVEEKNGKVTNYVAEPKNLKIN
ncbi:MAG: hypothetical protein WCG98_08875 [bacterium]